MVLNNQPGHFIRECLLRIGPGGSQMTIQSSAGENFSQASRGRGHERGSGVSTSALTESIGQTSSQARVYAITRQEAPIAPDVVMGIYTILGHDAFILIDPGSTYSFISYEFASKVNGTIESLEHDICISMLAGGVVVMNKVVRSCLIVVDDMNLHANFVVIKLEEFNMILRIDWLSHYHDIVNCYTKEVVI